MASQMLNPLVLRYEASTNTGVSPLRALRSGRDDNGSVFALRPRRHVRVAKRMFSTQNCARCRACLVGRYITRAPIGRWRPGLRWCCELAGASFRNPRSDGYFVLKFAQAYLAGYIRREALILAELYRRRASATQSMLRKQIRSEGETSCYDRNDGGQNSPQLGCLETAYQLPNCHLARIYRLRCSSLRA